MTDRRTYLFGEGKRVIVTNEDQFTDLIDLTVRDYLDFKPFYDRYQEEMIVAIKEGEFFG